MLLKQRKVITAIAVREELSKAEKAARALLSFLAEAPHHPENLQLPLNSDL